MRKSESERAYLGIKSIPWLFNETNLDSASFSEEMNNFLRKKKK